MGPYTNLYSSPFIQGCQLKRLWLSRAQLSTSPTRDGDPGPGVHKTPPLLQRHASSASYTVYGEK